MSCSFTKNLQKKFANDTGTGSFSRNRFNISFFFVITQYQVLCLCIVQRHNKLKLVFSSFLLYRLFQFPSYFPVCTLLIIFCFSPFRLFFCRALIIIIFLNSCLLIFLSSSTSLLLYYSFQIFFYKTSDSIIFSNKHKRNYCGAGRNNLNLKI